MGNAIFDVVDPSCFSIAVQPPSASAWKCFPETEDEDWIQYLIGICPADVNLETDDFEKQPGVHIMIHPDLDHPSVRIWHHENFPDDRKYALPHVKWKIDEQ